MGLLTLLLSLLAAWQPPSNAIGEWIPLAAKPTQLQLRKGRGEGPREKADWVCEAYLRKLGHPQESATYASLVQLVADPEKLNGKLVCVAGFFDLEYEDAALYINKEDAENNLPENAIWVDPGDVNGAELRPFSGKYVWILGKFRAGPIFAPPAAAPAPPSNMHVVGGLEDIRQIVEAHSQTQTGPPKVWISPHWRR